MVDLPRGQVGICPVRSAFSNPETVHASRLRGPATRATPAPNDSGAKPPIYSADAPICSSLRALYKYS